MKLKETVDFHLKSTWHAMSRMYNSIANKYDLSQTIAYVLINVEKEGTPATKIAPLMGMEPTSLSRLLKNMEKKGLIFREGDKDDKRIVRIFLTSEGVAKRKLAKQTVLTFNEKLMEKLKQTDIEQMVKVFDIIKQCVRDEIGDNENLLNKI
jgi:MarR family transcriptional regulator, organic hydroperoxide resistance regulator